MLSLLAVAGEESKHVNQRVLEVLVAHDEQISMPSRIYIPVRDWEVAVLEWNDTRRSIALTRGTRPHDGFYRESCLRRVLPITEVWQAGYAIALLGEYVIEISSIAIDALKANPELVSEFCHLNRAFVETTRRRAISYYDCYHREKSRSYKEFPPVAFLTEALK
ncbi:MAG: hypothetical protein ACK57J_19375, partial [Rubrivivax sp.]